MEKFRNTEEEAREAARQNRIQNFVFSKQVQDKIKRNKRIPKFDLAYMISRVDPRNTIAFYWDYNKREVVVEEFNRVFNVNVKI